jgi:hypothetical protein
MRNLLALGALLLGACGTLDRRSSQSAADSGAAAPSTTDTAAPAGAAGQVPALDLRPLIGARSSSRGELPTGLAFMAGWMILPGARDQIEFRIVDGSYQGQRVLMLQHVYERDSTGHLTWEVADAMPLPAVPAGYTLVRGTCSADGSIAAIARADVRRGAAYRVVTRAWRADLKRRRFAEVPTAGLRCVNKPLGAP